LTLDRDLLDAFVPEFEAEALRLATVRDAAAASRALDQLRAMAAALGAPSLAMMVERAAEALDPLDLPALAAAAEALAGRARAIGEAGEDLPPPPPTLAVPEAEPQRALDRELLDAFAPEFEAACDRLAACTDGATAARALDSLRALAGTAGLASLQALLERGPALLEAGDLPGLSALAAAARSHAARVILAREDLPAAPEPAAAPPAATGARRRVLIVDDSPMMRRLVREIIAADPDFEPVGEAPDGRAALAAMEALSPDLTLLDIEMPELDGIGVLRHWAIRGGGAVVVVSSAARPGSATAIEARRLGAAGIVGKPSGALSPDLRERQGEALRRTVRRAAGLPA
jgi:CheY-like chemotaxis protein